MSSGLVAWTASAFAQGVGPSALYSVGMRQVEFVDSAEGGRPLDVMLLYPAAPAAAAVLFKIFLATNLHLYKDAPVVSDGLKRPLVMFSHGAGGNGSVYAWFGEYLASHGYIVAMVYHYRANTYESSALYVRNRIWQRPRDISLDISHLLQDQAWGPHIDPTQIGVAGHSQGGFTSLWIGGAQVNPDLFVAYQRGWKNNQMVPAYQREQMSIDPELPANCATVEFGQPLRWLPAISGDSAWTTPGFGRWRSRLTSSSEPATLQHQPMKTRGLQQNIFHMRSSTCCLVRSITRSSTMSATR
jgi:hypothetical protein